MTGFSAHETQVPLDATSNAQPRGTWRLTYVKGRPAACLTCPICSTPIVVTSISAKGSIDGIVSCVTAPACRWFAYLTLEAWGSDLATPVGASPPDPISDH